MTGTHQRLEPLGLALFLFSCLGLMEQRTRWAGIDAFPTVGAGLHITPWIIEAANDLAVLAAPAHIPDMCTLHFIANPHAAGAKNAAVVIEPKLWGKR